MNEVNCRLLIEDAFTRAVSIAIVPLTVAPFAAGALSPLVDGLLIGTILIHSHIGFQCVIHAFVFHSITSSNKGILELTCECVITYRSVITDYLPRWRVPRTRRLFDWGLNLALLIVGWGWYEFETNDVGLTAAVKRIWTAKPQEI